MASLRSRDDNIVGSSQSELSSQELLANSSSQAEARLLARTEVDARRELHNGTNNAGDSKEDSGFRNISREDIMLNSTFVLFQA